MVIFLDIQRQIVKIYSETGIRTLEFDNIDMLGDIVGRNKILYVTNAISVSAADIISTVNSIKSQIHKTRVNSGEIMYIRNGTFGALTIPDVYNKSTRTKEDLVFRSSTDAKLLKDFYRDYGKDVFETSPVMRNLLKKGNLQIVTEGELQEINAKIKSGKLKRFNSVAESKAYIKKQIKTISKEEAEERIELGDVGGKGGPISRRRSPSDFANEKVIIDETGEILEEGNSDAAGFIDGFLRDKGVFDE